MGWGWRGVSAGLSLYFDSSLYLFVHSTHIFGMLIICPESGSWKYNNKQSLCSHDTYILVYSEQINTFWLLLSAVRENQAAGGGRRGWQERRVYLCLCLSRDLLISHVCLISGICSEKCLIRQSHCCASITWTNLDAFPLSCSRMCCTFICLAGQEVCLDQHHHKHIAHCAVMLGGLQ